MTVNTQASAKKKRGPGKPFTKGDPRINVKGAPKRGESWAETIKKIGELDGPSVAALWDTQHKEFAKLPEGITMKQLVVMTVYAALLREPSPGNWRELMERADGKVKGEVENSGRVEIVVTYSDQSAESTHGPTDDQARG